MEKVRPGLMLLTLALVVSCNSSENSIANADTLAKSIFKKEQVEVGVANVQQGIFNLEILSNGKAFAISNAEIRFPISGRIQNIHIRNGQAVKKGQILASLDATELRNKVLRTHEAINKARIDLDDRLIDYGYRLKDSAKVPAEIMRMAKMRSGYNTAQYEYADARITLSKTNIIAPFSGKIADLEARPFNNSESFKKLCTLINDSKMLVEFNVLETEYRFANRGSAIEVMPYGNGSLKGIVTEINPLIDENGMIKITGIVDNPNGRLLNGMSVKVIIRKPVADIMYVPKEAVVQRDGREVAFTYEDGKAKWNYVQTGLQNSRYISITSGLSKSQKVIVSNNINLAHDSEVVPAKTGTISE